MNHKFIAIAVFAAAYILIIAFYHRKAYTVWGACAVLLAVGVLGLREALYAVNWNVILLYFGMLFVSEVFLYSKMPDYLATVFASKTSNTAIAMMVICAFTGGLSIFLENVAVVLLVAPIAISISAKCHITPVPLFIGMAVCSNLQGTATLIGDPPSMLLGAFAGLTFNDFFWLKGKPGIFFAVQVGAVTGLGVLYYFFRRHRKGMPELAKTQYISLVPSVLVAGLVGMLIYSSFIENLPAITAGALCCIFGAIATVWYLWHARRLDVHRFAMTLDWPTGVFLIGVFILVESLAATGVIADLAAGIISITGSNKVMAYLIIVWLSVMVSAVVDNVPFLVAMLPVTKIISDHIGASEYLFYFGLLIGASVGGNITPIGASANIVAMGIIKKHGYEVSFKEFVRIGLPFTIAAVLLSSAFVWFFYE
ncbi:MAG: hypothetical protein A2Y12_13480 [Planctomycetes bacterium GWF2_42_9]|nr:MAG: hypothetical protein A2Y12_13480 [Planctomycetes bacterium GWF2_42_9]